MKVGFWLLILAYFNSFDILSVIELFTLIRSEDWFDEGSLSSPVTSTV